MDEIKTIKRMEKLEEEIKKLNYRLKQKELQDKFFSNNIMDYNLVYYEPNRHTGKTR